MTTHNQWLFRNILIELQKLEEHLKTDPACTTERQAKEQTFQTVSEIADELSIGPEGD